MVLDECLAHPADEDAARTVDGAHAALGVPRARSGFSRCATALVPGVAVTNPARRSSASCRAACFPGLREESARQTVEIGFEAYAIGGLSVGEPVDVDVRDRRRARRRCLPADRPRYLMGTGTPADLVESVARGVDLFDCVLPTRNARNGQLFTSEGRINIKNARYAEDDRPPDPGVRLLHLPTCSRAYLRHLYMAGEINAATLNTLHNLNFYLDTLRRIRDAIAFGRFESFRLAFHQSLSRQSHES